MGGLSVLAPTLAVLPNAPIAYVADFAGMPYGEKSEIEVASRVCALLGRMSERLSPRLVVIACNTASTIALAHVRSVLEIPVVGTVPAIKPAALASSSGVIGLLGTEATLRQPYVDQLQAEFAATKTLIRHPAPDLVAAAEAKLRGEAVDPRVFDLALSGLTDQLHGHAIDQIVLGCTHFPLVKDELRAAALRLQMNPAPAFVDGGAGIARRIAQLTDGQPWPAIPQRHFFTTGHVKALDSCLPTLTAFGFGGIRSV